MGVLDQFTFRSRMRSNYLLSIIAVLLALCVSVVSAGGMGLGLGSLFGDDDDKSKGKKAKGKKAGYSSGYASGYASAMASGATVGKAAGKSYGSTAPTLLADHKVSSRTKAREEDEVHALVAESNWHEKSDALLPGAPPATAADAIVPEVVKL